MSGSGTAGLAGRALPSAPPVVSPGSSPTGDSAVLRLAACRPACSITSTSNGATLDSHRYTGDVVGNITQEVIGGANPSTSSFAHDDLYRLTSATVNGASYSYVYDQVGNRLSQTAGGVTTNYAFDSADHLTAVNGHAVTSDANGNITQDDTGGLYSWDVRGRLVGLTKSGSSYAFTYGPDNLRVSKSVNGILTTYLLNGDQVVTDTINGTAYQNLFGPGTDHPLARNGEFFLPNHLSSTTGLTNGSGALTQGYLYGPFGESLNTPSDSNQFQYTGRENDGDGLLYYRARYYCPAWGRFISADPLSVGGAADLAAGSGPLEPAADLVSGPNALEPVLHAGVEQDGGWRMLNPYAYCGNNPISHTDPSGQLGELAELEQELESQGPAGQDAALALLAAYALYQGTANVAGGIGNAASDLWNHLHFAVGKRPTGTRRSPGRIKTPRDRNPQRNEPWPPGLDLPPPENPMRKILPGPGVPEIGSPVQPFKNPWGK